MLAQCQHCTTIHRRIHVVYIYTCIIKFVMESRKLKRKKKNVFSKNNFRVFISWCIPSQCKVEKFLLLPTASVDCKCNNTQKIKCKILTLGKFLIWLVAPGKIKLKNSNLFCFCIFKIFFYKSLKLCLMERNFTIYVGVWEFSILRISNKGFYFLEFQSKT